MTEDKLSAASAGSKTSIITVTSYKDRSAAGHLSNPYLGYEGGFCSTSQLLFKLEELLEEMKQPQRAIKPRSFCGLPSAPVGEATEPEGKTIARFSIKVMFRQNASWQGSVVWMDKNAEVQFRSVMELMLLLDSALASLSDN